MLVWFKVAQEQGSALQCAQAHCECTMCPPLTMKPSQQSVETTQRTHAHVNSRSLLYHVYSSRSYFNPRLQQHVSRAQPKSHSIWQGRYIVQYPYHFLYLYNPLSSLHVTTHKFSALNSSNQTRPDRPMQKDIPSDLKNAIMNSSLCSSCILCSEHAVRRDRAAVVLGSEVGALGRYERVPLGEESDG